MSELARAARDIRGEVLSNDRVAADAFVLRFAETQPSPLAFAPGEFIQVAAWTLDPLLRRPMSVLDWGRLPDGRGWVSFLYQVTGRGTKAFAALRPGDRIRALGPLGRGFPDPGRPGPALIVAGGVGVAPFLLLARHLRARGREVVVLLGARDSDHLYLVAALEVEGARVRCPTDRGDRGSQGLVTALLEEELRTRGPSSIGRLYACGPEPMLRAVHAIARQHDVPGDASLERRMACGYGVCFTCVCPMLDRASGVVRNERTCLEGPVIDLALLPLNGF